MTPSLFEQNLAVTAQRVPQPQVDIRADFDTRYAKIDEVVQTIRRAGFRKVGFVSTPER
jgi:biopolymer transport protein ExbD